MPAAVGVHSQSEQSGKADVVWVIDNSGSMGTHAANARTNFQTFLTSISAARDLKVALISKDGDSGTAMSFPEMFKGKENYFHIKHSVGSRDALALAAKASCKTIQNAVQTICATPGLEQIQTESGNTNSLNGALVNFFREDARRIYVFVTDDNVDGVTDSNFLNFVKYEAPGSLKPVVYAFRGMGGESNNSSCSVSQDGVAYDALANQTGGKVYSICDQDWSASFKDLSEGIIRISGSGFVLKHQDIAEVLSVTLNGVSVEKENYTLAGGKLGFKDGLLTAEGQKIEIKYRFK